MVRNYKKKSIQAYSNQDILDAIKEIRECKSSIRGTAKKYNIPFDTLRRWVVNPPSHMGSGRNTYFTEIEEKCLVQAMQFTSSCGYPFDRSDLVRMVESYLNFSRKPNPFPNKSPGKDWIMNFEKRWEKELSKRKPELLTKSRANSLTKEVVDEFFSMYENVLTENHLWDQPHRIFNVDETGLSTNPVSSKVYVGKRSRNCYLECPTGGKTMYTVLFCVSATGQYMAPLTVYKGKHLYDTWTKGGPNEGIYAVSPSGWMQDDVFEQWIEHFIRSVKQMKLTLPVLLVYDGHGSHLTYGTVKKAIENQVIILCIPPNTSHALQPLDVGVFSSLKLNWRKVLKTWFRESRMQNVSKAVFPSLLKKLFEALSSENAIGGFLGSGLFPPNRAVVYKRIVTQNATEPAPQSYVPIATTSQPSSSAAASAIIEKDESSIGSPFKHIRSAILSTISPVPSTSCTEAMKNAKRKRTRMQKKTGEILTTQSTLDRLHAEKVKRENKSSKMPTKRSKRNERLSSEENCSNDFQLFDDDLSVKVGRWVLVEFSGKKSKQTFHGIILSINDETFTVKFAKESESSFLVFPEREDVSEVDASQIVKVLPDPLMNHRGQYYFP